MKYLDNQNDNMGIMGVSDQFAQHLMESNGIQLPEMAPDVADYIFYENDGSIFGVDEEVFQDGDGYIYAKLQELDGGVYLALQESDQEVTNTVEVDNNTFSMGEDIMESEGSYYVSLLTTEPKHEDNEDYVLNVEGMDGRDFVVVDESDSEHADFIAYVKEDEDGSLTLVSEDEDHDYALPVVEAKKNGKDEKNGKNGKNGENGNGNGNGDDDDDDEDNGDENGDPKAFGGKKGDKSKTKSGKLDFIKGKK